MFVTLFVLFVSSRYCEQNGNEGCFTDNIPSCRTCYLSTDIYMAATNTTEESRPDWAPCPCCVPTTLEDSHIDVEVKYQTVHTLIFLDSYLSVQPTNGAMYDMIAYRTFEVGDGAAISSPHTYSVAHA